MPKTPPVAYTPEPFDISGIELDGATAALIERLAANVHDVWARQRMDAGWTFGPARDDVAKVHPSLVPYRALPEEEKGYDRNMVRNALLPLLKLGYTLAPPTETGELITFAGPMAAAGDASATQRQIAAAGSVAALTEIWRARDAATWEYHPELFAGFAQRLLRMGEVLLAYEAVTAGLRRVPDNLRLRQLQGLALSRSGALDAAIAVLTSVRDDTEQTPDQLEETLGTLGGVYKSAALKRPTPKDAQPWYEKAHASYYEAFQRCRGYYSGINAATTALLAGSESLAAALAQDVRSICLELLHERRAAIDRYYLYATLGEASLLLRRFAEAKRWYRRAARTAGERVADLASTRRNALLITRIFGTGQQIVEAALRLPRIGALVVPDSGTEEVLTPEAETPLAQAIEDLLEKNDVQFAYSTGYSDTATLYLEQMQGRGRTHVVLPYADDELAAARLRHAGGSDWVERAQRVIASADEVLVATERAFSSDAVLRRYADQLALGLAVVQAEQLGAELIITTSAAAPGPSISASEASAGASAGSTGLRTLLLDEAREMLANTAPTPSAVPMDDARDTHVCSIIFADVVHSSALTDEQQPVFVERFMGAVGELMRRCGQQPVTRNTWGDGLYLVFKGVRDGGVLALQLRDLVRETDWAAAGLPAGLSLRIGLHAGPIFAYRDPVTGTINYTGKHTIRAARIEPVTAADAVYASREFTALATLACPGTFLFTPVGQIDLAKHSASVPLFALEWGAPREVHARQPAALA